MKKLRNHKLRWQCDKCVLGFAKLRRLQLHQRRHTAKSENDRYHCLLCKDYVAFFTEPEHREHMRVAHVDTCLICPKCPKKFKPFDHVILERHLQTHNRDVDYYTCYSCGRIFKDRDKMLVHRNRAGKYHDGKCRICPEFETKSWRQNLKHFNEVHDGTIQYKCGFCPSNFYTIAQVRIHVKDDCQGEKTNQVLREKAKKVCELCGLSITFSNIKYHMQDVHGDHQLPCDTCGNIYKHPESLRRHMANHIKDTCDVCGYMNSRKKVVEHKKQEHTPEHLKPYQCNVCQKGFAKRSNWISHQNVHTGAKPYACPYCSQAFANEGTLGGHVRGVPQRIETWFIEKYIKLN